MDKKLKQLLIGTQTKMYATQSKSSPTNWVLQSFKQSTPDAM
jgi:hypothetical protein